MNRNSLFLFTVVIAITGSLSLHAQKLPEKYYTAVAVADSLFENGNYKRSAEAYSSTFYEQGNRGVVKDRYAAARAWALAGGSDSAFYQLERITKNAGYYDYAQITSEADFDSLKKDKRWEVLLKQIIRNGKEIEKKLERSLPGN